MGGEELRDTTQFLDSLNHRYKPREMSYWTLLLGSIGVVSMALYALWVGGQESGIAFVVALGDPSAALMALGVALVIAAVVVEVVSRTRHCCPWRVKEQLKLALYTANLLPLDTREWSHLLRIKRAKREGKGLLSIRFELLGARCNQETMSAIADSSSFRHAQRCEIKPYTTRRGRINGWILYVWFVPMSDFYEGVIGGKK